MLDTHEVPESISRSTAMGDTAAHNGESSISSSDLSDNQTGRKGYSTPAVSCSLKRKRPTSLEIPQVLREIRADNKLALRDFAPPENRSCFSGFGVGVSSVKGKKKFMEDSYKIVSFSRANKGFFGVYDGHGGSKAVEFVTQNLHRNILEMLDYSSENAVKEEVFKAAYLKTDQEFLKQGLGSGVCCVTALIEGREIFVSNLGDCRAVLCRGGKAEALTKDHRAAEEDERKRIEEKGGYVEMHRGAWRVHGVLSVSRSIGDAHLKDWVPAKPDTKILFLTTDMEYLVLASDGLWEEVGNQEAVDIVMQSCSSTEKKQGNGTGNDQDEKGDKFDCVSTSPSSKLRRVSLVKQKKRAGHHSSSSPSYKRILGSWKEAADTFRSENEIPPSKSRRISSEVNVHSPRHHENSGGYEKTLVASGGLVAACKELVELAVNRGSLDDITVMIIDLQCFKA